MVFVSNIGILYSHNTSLKGASWQKCDIHVSLLLVKWHLHNWWAHVVRNRNQYKHPYLSSSRPTPASQWTQSSYFLLVKLFTNHSLLTDIDRSWQTVVREMWAVPRSNWDWLACTTSALYTRLQCLSGDPNIIKHFKYQKQFFFSHFSLFSLFPQIIQEHKDLIFRIRVLTKFEVLLNL